MNTEKNTHPHDQDENLKILQPWSTPHLLFLDNKLTGSKALLSKEFYFTIGGKRTTFKGISGFGPGGTGGIGVGS
jgi:hypothetical protein